MITLTLMQVIIILGVNVGVLAFLVFDWFKRTYTIVDIETWNKCAEAYNEKIEREDSEDLASGCGFFREALYEEDIEEGEEDD